MATVTSETLTKVTEAMNVHVANYKRRSNQMAEIAGADLFPNADEISGYLDAIAKARGAAAVLNTLSSSETDEDTILNSFSSRMIVLVTSEVSYDTVILKPIIEATQIITFAR